MMSSTLLLTCIMQHTSFEALDCPIARSLDRVGER
jgi:hypothetical protein